MPTEEGNAAVVNAPADSQVTAPTESTPVETKAPVLDEDGIDISWAQSDGSDQNEEDTDESNPEPQEPQQEEAKEAEPVDTQEEQEQPSKAEARKEQLNTEIRDLVAQRNQIRQEVEQLNAQVYKPASSDELLEQVNPETGDYYNRVEAQLEAMRQEREVEKYNTQVTESRLSLQSEAARALDEFPMFDSQSPEYNPSVAQQVDQMLAQNLIVDQNTGQIIGSHVSPYTLYKTVADAAKFSAAQSAAKSQKAVETMQSQADIPTSAPVKQTPKDIEKLDADAYAKAVGLKEYRF